MCLLYRAVLEGLVFQHKFAENTPELSNSLGTSFGNHCISTVTSVVRGLKCGLKNMACNRFRAVLGHRVLHAGAVQRKFHSSYRHHHNNQCLSRW